LRSEEKLATLVSFIRKLYVLYDTLHTLRGDEMFVKARLKLYNGEREFSGVVLVDTGASGVIVDESLASELGLKTFGRGKIATLGATVECRFADVSSVIVEDVEIGPRRVLVCGFPEEVKERLKLMGFSEKVILGVSAIEDAGYVPDTERGVLRKVGFLAL
jgi:predicted aspartyl protease